MPKIQKNNQIPLKRLSFTPDEISKVREELKNDFTFENKERWFVLKGAIKVKEYKGHKDWYVVQLPDGSFPYTHLSDLMSLAESQKAKERFASNQNGKYYDSIIEQKDTLFTQK